MKKIFVLIIFAVFILAGFYFVFLRPAVAPENPSSENLKSHAVPEVSDSQVSDNLIEQNGGQKQEKVFLAINFGDGQIENIELSLAEKMTAFDLLKRGAESKGYNVATKISSAGAYVDAVGNKTGGTDGKYWLYYYNGETAPISADQLELKAGDRVEWRFEKPSF